MQKKIVWAWDQLTGNVSRAKVIGGWIVHHRTIGKSGITSESMVFVADRDHEWVCVEPPIEERPQAEKLAANFSRPDKQKA